MPVRKANTGAGRPRKDDAELRRTRGVAMPGSLWDLLDILARKADVSRSGYVESLLREALAARGYDVAPTPLAAPAQPQEGE